MSGAAVAPTGNSASVTGPAAQGAASPATRGWAHGQCSGSLVVDSAITTSN